MPDPPNASSLTRGDLFLAVAAVAGLALFVFLMPRVHPDAGIVADAGPDTVMTRAEAFARDHGGVDVSQASASITIHRHSALIDSLQDVFGRTEAIRMLQDRNVYGHFWRVDWITGEERDELGAADLTLDGRVIGFRVNRDAAGPRRPNLGALSSAFETPLDADTLEGRRFSFSLDADRSTGVSEGIGQFPTGRLILGRQEAVRLARYHLQETGLENAAANVDSVYLSGSDGVVAATVSFVSSDTTLGRRFKAAVEILPGGALERLELRPIEDGDDESQANAFAELLPLVVFGILTIIILVVFFRRLHARLVDTRTALRDALLFGAAAGAAATGQVVVSGDVQSVTEMTMVLVGLLLVGSLAAVLMFFVIAAVSSLVRDVWPEKLHSVDLMRRGVARNVPVGSALLRGSLIALALCGLATLTYVLPSTWIDLSEGSVFYHRGHPLTAVGTSIANAVFYAGFLTFAVLYATAGLLHIRFNKWIPAILAIAAVFAVAQTGPLDARPWPAEFASSALIGVGFAWAVLRFDILTTLTAAFVFYLAWASIDGLILPDSPAIWATVSSLGILAMLLVTGFVGVASRRSIVDVPAIVPEYIEEHARQARITRELELAREVQLSFLPAENPDVPQLDIASVCLPANEVGGDYYDFIRVDASRLAIVIGDVSGKGMQAAFYMTLMKGILQSMIASGCDQPGEVLARANDVFRANAPRGIFMSMVLAIIDVDAGTFVCARAGHNPVLVHAMDSVRPVEVKPGGAAIGLLDASVFRESIEPYCRSVVAGDQIFIYTDGVTEAMNGRRELYGVERLENVITAASARPAAEVLDAVVGDVEDFTGAAPRHDDMTMIVIRITDE